MPKYIDANEIFYDQLLNTGNKEHPFEYAVSKKRIDDMPAADVVEVVRCKDCIHYVRSPYYIHGEHFMVCNYIIGGEHVRRQPEDFCSRGERREDAVY